MTYKMHWESVYCTTPVNKLGWYEEKPIPSLKLLEQCELGREAKILNIGAGATTFVDELVKNNYKNIIANDISNNALYVLKQRLGESHKNIKWVVDDLTKPNSLKTENNVDLWYDRAVLHFFIEEEDKNTYFNLLDATVKQGGYVIIAVFNLNGAEKCCKLPINKYSTQMLQDRLGHNYKLLNAFNYIYTNPNGHPRPYVYTLFKKMNDSFL